MVPSSPELSIVIISSSWFTRILLIKKARISGLLITLEPRLLCVSFFVPSPSGRCPAETANFLLLQVMSYNCPIMIGGAGGS